MGVYIGLYTEDTWLSNLILNAVVLFLNDLWINQLFRIKMISK